MVSGSQLSGEEASPVMQFFSWDGTHKVRGCEHRVQHLHSCGIWWHGCLVHFGTAVCELGCLSTKLHS